MEKEGVRYIHTHTHTHTRARTHTHTYRETQWNITQLQKKRIKSCHSQQYGWI